jgi:acetyl-CoA acyltransferase
MKRTLKDVYVVAMGRSAVAKAGKKSALRNLHPVDIGGLVLKGVLERFPALKPADIDDVICGCATPEQKQGVNIGRLVAARAGLPVSVPGMTVNRFCSSGLQAIDIAATMIEAGQADCIVAGGVESMTAVPMIDDPSITDPWLMKNKFDFYFPMGITAEAVALARGITREEMDAMAMESHRRAAAAQDAGKFADEIIPLPGVDDDDNPITFHKDQGIRRDTTLEALADLKTPFRADGLVTAGNSSQVSDGASFLVLMNGEMLKKLGAKPIARFIAFAVAACEPSVMGLGPVYAVPKVLERTGLTIEQMDVIELNEAFAAQAIPVMRQLGMDPAKVNPNGGALAMGHPMGATGGVLSCKALNEAKRIGGKYAMVTMCIGGGQGAVGIYELC